MKSGGVDLNFTADNTCEKRAREEAYLRVLKKELIPALGCTEPIAIAYACARVRRLLGDIPDRLCVALSGNILKNVKSVVVPNSGGRKGARIAAVLGTVCGDDSRRLEVLEDVKPEDLALCDRLCAEPEYCSISLLETDFCLHLRVDAFSGGRSACVEIAHSHTNIIYEEADGVVLSKADAVAAPEQDDAPRFCLSDIVEFAQTVPLDEIRPMLARQISMNLAAAREGLRGTYGLCVGKTMLRTADGLPDRVAACYAAASSDARMGGCRMPVVINSGSGNQGAAVSLPVILYAECKGVSEERMYRALALSNLLAVYQKQSIGSLSAYCGAVSAASAAAAGAAFLDGKNLDVIEKTVRNMLADVAGMICDGAKASCAAKIYSAVTAAFLAYHLAAEGHSVEPGDGLAVSDIDVLIGRYGRIACDGMRQMDRMILQMMAETV